MFEMIGNFDKGQEKLEGPQLETTIGLCRAVMSLWKRDLDMIRFQREFTNQKTCPGSGIELRWFLDQFKRPQQEVKPKVSKDDAEKIIRFLSAGYMATSSKEARAEFNRLANEIRKAAGIPVQ